MTQTAPWTIGRLLQWTAGYLRDQGAESPRLDAEVLLAHVRNCRRIDLYTAFDEVAGDEIREAYRELVKRRAAGTPVAYLVGHKEFYSLSFEVTPAVLIPRPETEFLIVKLLDVVKASREQGGDQAGPIRVADVGVGSGNIAVTVAKHLPSAQITAIDISHDALQVAQRNAVRHGVEGRIEFVESDLFSSLPTDSRFDFIVSNPPYIGLAEKPSLSRDVVDHEPHLALFAGADGTDVLQRLIPQAAERLKPGGWLMSEISPRLRDVVCQLMHDEPRLGAPSVADDLARLPRLVMAQRVD